MIFRAAVLVALLLLHATVLADTDLSRQTQLKQQVNANKNKLPPAVYQYYQDNGFTHLWMKDNVLLPNAYDLYSILVNADSKGLNADDYWLDDIRQRWNVTDVAIRAELEILLTRAFEKYCRQLVNGRWKPHEVDQHWHISTNILSIKNILNKLESKPVSAIINNVEPEHKGYHALIKHLKIYQAIEKQGGWPLIAEGPKIRLGQEHPQIPEIRRRLRATKDLILNAMDVRNRMDATLMEAVMLFQARHGLVIDGVIGRRTRAAMNVPVETRINQIKVNIERWRWLPSSLGDRYLLINLTGFELNAVEDDKIVLTMPIIIGKKYRETPSFSGQVRYLEINPYWTIPKSIALKDLIPVQLRDQNFFKRKKIKVFDGWSRDAKEVDVSTLPLRKLNQNYFPYLFRQEPGSSNSLGRVKFMFPNPYDIYLHDTPDRYLFDRRVRAFSSGCIRVSDPIRLTAYLLNAPTQQKEEDVLKLIYRGENRAISLVSAVPIYLLYRTAWTDWDGKLSFRNDIYGRDALMINKLK